MGSILDFLIAGAAILIGLFLLFFRDRAWEWYSRSARTSAGAEGPVRTHRWDITVTLLGVVNLIFGLILLFLTSA